MSRLNGASLVLIVLDGLGVGAASDSHAYGDASADTASLLSDYGALLPWTETDGHFGSLEPTFSGKGTTTGHWELVGAQSAELAPIRGEFPAPLTELIRSVVGHDPLFAAYHSSGQQLINDVGLTSIQQRRVIAYSSDDAVLQLAASSPSIEIEELRRWARALAIELPRVAPLGRVITRPFEAMDGRFVRVTGGRRDFHARPSGRTALERMRDIGVDVTIAGKAVEIFHWLDGTTCVPGPFGREELANLMLDCAGRHNHLLVLNVPEVDDLLHDLQLEMAAERLTEITEVLQEVNARMPSHATVILTGDHGCDIRVNATANTRERVPFLVCGSGIPDSVVLSTHTMSAMQSVISSAFGQER